MICEMCSGTGRVLPMTNTHLILSWYPCPGCEGRGVVHCCEGDVEQPDESKVLPHPLANADPPIDRPHPTE